MKLSKHGTLLVKTYHGNDLLKYFFFLLITCKIYSLVNEREFKMGNIHCLELCPDSPFVIALGGDKKSNNFTVFDLQNIDPGKK